MKCFYEPECLVEIILRTNGTNGLLKYSKEVGNCLLENTKVHNDNHF